MTESDQPKRTLASDLLDAANMIFREQFERGDQLAVFNFARLYVRFGGAPADIPVWVAQRLLRIAGEWATDAEPYVRDGKPPKRTIQEVSGLTGKKVWDQSAKSVPRAIFGTLFERNTERARAAIAAHGSAFRKEPGRDSKPVPIPGNEYVNDRATCAIVDHRMEFPRFRGQSGAFDQQALLGGSFIVDGRQVSQGRVAPAGVVPAFNEAEDGHAGLCFGLECPSVQQLAFKGGEEALAQGVVVGVAD